MFGRLEGIHHSSNYTIWGNVNWKIKYCHFRRPYALECQCTLPRNKKYQILKLEVLCLNVPKICLKNKNAFVFIVSLYHCSLVFVISKTVCAKELSISLLRSQANFFFQCNSPPNRAILLAYHHKIIAFFQGTSTSRRSVDSIVLSSQRTTTTAS